MGGFFSGQDNSAQLRAEKRLKEQDRKLAEKEKQQKISEAARRKSRSGGGSGGSKGLLSGLETGVEEEGTRSKLG